MCVWILDIISLCQPVTPLSIDINGRAFFLVCEHIFSCMYKGETVEQTGLMQSKYQRNIFTRNMDSGLELRTTKWHIEYVLSEN